MNGTPRLRSAFPETPKTESGSRLFNNSPLSRPRKSVIRPSSVINATPTQPLRDTKPQIPESLIDGPQQRFWALSLWVALWTWKLYDCYTSSGSYGDSTWLFLKWVVIDAIFLVALPALRIPWLEWSFTTFLVVWLAHVVLDYVFINGIWTLVLGVPAWIWSRVYTKELSLSDTRVDPVNLVHASDIILGKQIINLLPEGSAILNPGLQAYCLDLAQPTIELPIVINQTTPDSIELLRFDIDTDEVETIVIGAKQIKKLKKDADKGHDKTDTATPRTLRYPVSKNGLYRLQRVVDKSKLEVRRRSHDAAVVACPRASVSASSLDKCTGELSGISLHVTGVPPFQVRYTKRINQHQVNSITQSIQPAENENTDNIIMDPKRPQMGWTQSKTMSVDINESLEQNGTWTYIVEQVTDGLQNKVDFDVDNPKKTQAARHAQAITVHKRPRVRLNGCDAEHYLRVAREEAVRMPLKISPQGQIPASDWPLKMKYSFTAQSDDGIGAVEEFVRDIKEEKDFPLINKAGRYDLASIDSQFCQGEIDEPSTCLLYNPPRPSLNFQTEEIYDKCAGRPIGTMVNFDFTGTPPFKVRYEVTQAGRGTTPKVQNFDGMRGQLEIRERSAGSYKYRIVSIADDVYEPITIRSDDNVFEQNIRPPAEAFFKESKDTVRACLNSPVFAEVKLLGEGPWDLEYELVHSGKRKKFTAHSDKEDFLIEIPALTDGGKYTLVLAGVQDSSRCRTALKDERHVEVRPEQPRAAFGDIAGRRSVEALESKAVQIPLKLKGIAPWRVEIQNQNGVSAHVFKDVNSYVKADVAGQYQILSVKDTCPGVVDARANKFEISYIRRPELGLLDSTVEEQSSRIFRKQPVCQGDEDGLTLSLSGHSPYHIRYSVKAEPSKGQSAISNKPLSVASNNAAIAMDTSKAGHYTYTFTELADDRYAHDRKHFSPLTVRQEVFALPSAQFVNGGKTYGYCKDESEFPSETETENIPISLTGVPPFSLDIAIVHHGVSKKPEMIRVKDILSNTYSWSLSRSSLGLGTHTVQIRGVKDGRGCETLVDATPSAIRVQVSSPPRIQPLDSKTDYCVGDHLAFSLSGHAPFEVFYKFQNKERKARVDTNEFRRISDHAGEFAVTAIQDSIAIRGGGKCKAKQDIRKFIHPYPTVRVSHGKTLTTDIHEGGEVEIVFDFTGTPPFEFTYTRSENAKGLKRGMAPKVLETKHDASDDFTKIVRASDEGTYEVVSIKDAYCSYPAPGLGKMTGGKAQRLLT